MRFSLDRWRSSIGTVLSLSLTFCLLLTAGCRQDMHDQPRYEAFEASDFFEDGRASGRSWRGPWRKVSCAG